jgi:cell wall-associated NlpC family hydrolase
MSAHGTANSRNLYFGRFENGERFQIKENAPKHRQSSKMKHTYKIFYCFKSSGFFKLIVMTAVCLIVGCAAAPKPAGVTPPAATPSRVTKRPAVDTEIEKRLRQVYRRWQGTRHRLGGSGRQGIDCSGFVRVVYRDVFNIELPRSTRLQVRSGQAVSYKNLRAGDLVFFRPPSYPRHVGIYLGGSEFVHASKNKGVTVSKIDQTYWGKYYWTARRILPASQHP